LESGGDPGEFIVCTVRQQPGFATASARKDLQLLQHALVHFCAAIADPDFRDVAGRPMPLSGSQRRFERDV
jgi:hypothetical protein